MGLHGATAFGLESANYSIPKLVENQGSGFRVGTAYQLTGDVISGQPVETSTSTNYILHGRPLITVDSDNPSCGIFIDENGERTNTPAVNLSLICGTSDWPAPLRGCPEDVPRLIDHFLASFVRESGVRVRGVTVKRSTPTEPWSRGSAAGLVAFLGDGSFLPCRSGVNERRAAEGTPLATGANGSVIGPLRTSHDPPGRVGPISMIYPAVCRLTGLQDGILVGVP